MGWSLSPELLEDCIKKGLLTREQVYGKREAAPKAPGPSQTRKIDPDQFLADCERHGLPRPIAEHWFHPDRKWRFDWAFLDQRVALEIDGGAGWGRHTRKKGFIDDQEKNNEALLRGWKVFHCVPADVMNEAVFHLLKRALA